MFIPRVEVVCLIYSTLRQLTITQFCVNYFVHYTSFVQTIIVQFLHNRSIYPPLLILHGSSNEILRK